MKIQIDRVSSEQIDQCLSLLRDVIGDGLLGVYLYGSAVVGGLQKFSDIDLFVVISEATSLEQKARLAISMVLISGVYMKSDKRPVEMIVVVQSTVNPWKYPPSFDFQYGDWLRKDFEAGVIEPWKSKVMPDLAILITQVLLKSETLYGEPPEELLDKVPYQDFMTALAKELKSLLLNLENDTTNILLTFARIWATVETDSIYSKPAAASWAISRLPDNYRTIIEKASAASIGEADALWENVSETVLPCAEFIVSQIEKKLSYISQSDYDLRSIKIMAE